MQEYRSDGSADQGKLLVCVAAPVVHIQLEGDPIGGHSLLEDFLEIISAVIVKQTAAHQKAGMVVNDHDTVNPPAFSVFCNKRKITGIGLISMSE